MPILRKTFICLIGLMSVVIVAVGGMLGMGTVQRWRDVQICRAGTAPWAAAEDGQALPWAEQPESYRQMVRECVAERRAERSEPVEDFDAGPDRD